MGRSKLTVLCLCRNRANNRTSAHTAHARNFEIARAQGPARIRAVPPTHPARTGTWAVAGMWGRPRGQCAGTTPMAISRGTELPDVRQGSGRLAAAVAHSCSGRGWGLFPFPRACCLGHAMGQGQGSGPCPSARSCHAPATPRRLGMRQVAINFTMVLVHHPTVGIEPGHSKQ